MRKKDKNNKAMLHSNDKNFWSILSLQLTSLKEFWISYGLKFNSNHWYCNNLSCECFSVYLKKRPIFVHIIVWYYETRSSDRSNWNESPWCLLNFKALGWDVYLRVVLIKGSHIIQSKKSCVLKILKLYHCLFLNNNK